MEIVFSIHLLIIKQSISIRILMRPVAICGHSNGHRVRVGRMVIILVHILIITNCRICLFPLTFQTQITELLIGQSFCMIGIINKFSIFHRKCIICQVIIVLDFLLIRRSSIKRIPTFTFNIPISRIALLYIDLIEHTTNTSVTVILSLYFPKSMAPFKAHIITVSTN